MRHGSFTREFNCTAIRQIVQQSLSHYQSHGGINSKRLEGRKEEGGPGSIGVSVRARGACTLQLCHHRRAANKYPLLYL